MFLGKQTIFCRISKRDSPNCYSPSDKTVFNTKHEPSCFSWGDTGDEATERRGSKRVK